MTTRYLLRTDSDQLFIILCLASTARELESVCDVELWPEGRREPLREPAEARASEPRVRPLPVALAG